MFFPCIHLYKQYSLEGASCLEESVVIGVTKGSQTSVSIEKKNIDLNDREENGIITNIS